MAGSENSKGKLARFFSSNKYVFLSYGLTFLIIFIAFVLIGIYPFGELTIVKSDQYHASVGSIFDIRDKLMSGKSITYSWYGSYGSNLISYIFGWASSLFNVLSVFFTGKYAAEFIAITMLLRHPFAAVTLYVYGREKFKRDDLVLVAFSCLYALCAFVTAYHWNPMWMNSVIMLPLVALGLDRLVKEGRAKLYCISLSFAIFMHYGAAINLCYFSVAYFIILLFTEVKKDRFRKTISFSWYSIVAGGMAAITLIPSFWAAIGPGSVYLNEVAPTNIEIYNSFFKYYVNHYAGMIPTVLLYSDAVANIYVGVLSLILFPFFLFSKSVTRAQKILYTSLLGILFLCSDVNILEFILHGMHFPSNMPHRFSFLYSFVLVITALYAMRDIKNFRRHQYLSFFGFSMFSTVILYLMYNQNPQTEPAMFSVKILIVNLMFIAIYYLIILLMKCVNKKVLGQVIQIALVFVVFLELVLNSYMQFKFMCDGPRAAMGSDYYDAMKKITAELNKETGLYRAEFRKPESLADSRIYGYNGINAFSENTFYNLMIPFGYMKRTGMVFYNQTPVAAAVMNNKYMFNRDELIPLESPIFKLKKQVENIYLYENEYALPFGYMVKEDIETMGEYPFNNPYDYQEEFIKRAVGSKFDIFKDVSAVGNITTTYIAESQGGVTIINMSEDNDNSQKIPHMQMTFKPTESGYMSIFIKGEPVEDAYITIEGQRLNSSLIRRPSGFFDAGYVEEGTEVKFTIMIDKTFIPYDTGQEGYIGRYGDIEVYSAILDMDQFKEAIGILMEGGLEVTDRSETSIEATINVKEDGLLFLTLGTDPRWKAKVDGADQKLDIVAQGAAYALRLTPGEHQIQLKYSLSWEYYLGPIVGAIFIAVFVMSQKYDKKHPEKKRM